MTRTEENINWLAERAGRSVTGLSGHAWGIRSEIAQRVKELRAQLVATQVSPPTPPKCERCQQQMTWTATAPVIGAPMEWRCFNHVDVGEVSQGPLVSPPTPEPANQVLTTLTILRERGYLGVSVAEALKIARLPRPCKTCHGLRWVMKSLSTVAAGGIWNEACPDCSSPPPEPEKQS